HSIIQGIESVSAGNILSRVLVDGGPYAIPKMRVFLCLWVRGQAVSQVGQLGAAAQFLHGQPDQVVPGQR
ncbi:DNA binding domain, excisionase family, partial [Dysosmobacter welbionis]